jgi:hypothetical protein
MSRITKLQQEREGLVRLISAAERELNAPAPDLSPAKLDAFACAVRHKLKNGPVEFRKQYLRLFVDRIEVSDSEARGSEEVLARASAGGGGAGGKVPGFVQNWRPHGDGSPSQEVVP